MKELSITTLLNTLSQGKKQPRLRNLYLWLLVNEMLNDDGLANLKDVKEKSGLKHKSFNKALKRAIAKGLISRVKLESGVYLKPITDEKLEKKFNGGNGEKYEVDSKTLPSVLTSIVDMLLVNENDEEE